MLTVEERIGALEDFMEKTVPRLNRLEADQTAIKENTDEIVLWIKGAKTVYGFSLAHWRSIWKVALGFATALAYTSPRIHDIMNHIFWT